MPMQPLTPQAQDPQPDVLHTFAREWTFPVSVQGHFEKFCRPTATSTLYRQGPKAAILLPAPYLLYDLGERGHRLLVQG